MECGQLIKKLQNMNSKWYSLSFLLLLIFIWYVVSAMRVVPAFMLPSPLSVLQAFLGDFTLLMRHTATSLTEAGIGLGMSIVSAFLISALMDKNTYLYRALYPILLLTQTIPIIAVAPLLVLWLGYGLAPKVTLIFLVCFFPITIGLLDGFRDADPDAVILLRSMGATEWNIFWQLKVPSALPRFFSGLKIAVSYSIVSTVIAGWLGGNFGLGVYMMRVRRGFEFDKMFAVIFLVSVLSLLLMKLTTFLETKCTPWLERERKGR